jgi:anthranilate synthase component 2
MAHLLLLDNHDSFTWNLVHDLRALGATVDVVLNERVTVAGLLARSPQGIVISPGPGRPEAAGISVELVREAAGRVPLLGVCLGHQAIACAYGASVVRAPSLVHGKTSSIVHDGADLFRGLPSPFEAARYHSLVVDPATLPPALRVTARTPDGVIMGLRHADRPVFGVQFHPESVLTLPGRNLLANFLAELGAVAPCGQTW